MKFLIRLYNFFHSKDDKPPLLSFLVQNDEVTRAAGDFIEKDLRRNSAFITFAINGNPDDATARVFGNWKSDAEVSGALMKLAHKVANDGLQKIRMA